MTSNHSPEQSRRHDSRRPAHFVGFAVLALAICAAVPLVAAFEGWKIDNARQAMATEMTRSLG